MSAFPLQAGHPALAREAVRDLRFSAIRDVANAGIGRDDILPFWFGEPDLPTPAFICVAAQAALTAGDTFYTLNLGEPALREALAHSLSRLHQPVSAERIVVTSSGISALMLTAQALYSPRGSGGGGDAGMAEPGGVPAHSRRAGGGGRA